MRQLFPVHRDDVDPAEVYAADLRTTIDGRPWVFANMIASLDGAISVDGVSGGLGGPADKEVFAAIRAVADVILVGAGTVTAENYRQPNPSPEVRRARQRRGQRPAPALAIVTNSLSVPPDHRVFDGDDRPLVLTHAGAPADRRARLTDRAEVIDVGDTAVDLPTAVATLGGRGWSVVLVEGGPSLNGDLVDAGLIDEWCLSLSPLVVGGDDPGILAGAPPAGDRRFDLDRILHSDDLLFLRYLRAR